MTSNKICKNPKCSKSFFIRSKKENQKQFCTKSCAASYLQSQRSGDKNSNWKGGRTSHKKGYVLIQRPDHPRAHNGYVLEHIVVAESKISRYLTDDEYVVHVDKNKANNDPENLFIRKHGDSLIAEETLQHLISEKSTITQIALQASTSHAKVRRDLKFYGLQTDESKRRSELDGNCLICNKAVPRGSICTTCRVRIRRYRQKLAAINLLGGKCEICGWFGNLAGFDFDHREDKSYELSAKMNISWKTLKIELAKCRLLCARCHRTETHGYQLTVAIIERIAATQNIVTANNSLVYTCMGCGSDRSGPCGICRACSSKKKRYELKSRIVSHKGGRCASCGWIGSPEGFDLHHLRDKQFQISHKSNSSWDKIVTELDKCELLCTICHRVKHSDLENPRLLAAVSAYKGCELN